MIPKPQSAGKRKCELNFSHGNEFIMEMLASRKAKAKNNIQQNGSVELLTFKIWGNWETKDDGG